MDQPRTRLVAGCMTGTSLDGLDAALVEITGSGLEMKAKFLGMVSKPLGPLADQLRHFAEGRPATPIDYLRAARRLGELHADAVEELLRNPLPAMYSSRPGEGGEQVASGQRAGATEPGEGTHGVEGSCSAHQNPRTLDVPSPGRPPVTGHPLPGAASTPRGEGRSLDFVVAHGQTIWHAPNDREATPNAGLSWQLFDPWPLVRRLRVPVCYDLRQADLIAGGQGAPITPLADWIMFPTRTFRRVIVNLGGICNVTILSPNAAQDERVTGHDVGPCNILLDGIAQRLFNRPFDKDGALAAAGTSTDVVFDRLEARGVFDRDAGRSMGREDFSASWIDQLISDLAPTMSPNDILASAVKAIAMMVMDATFLSSSGLHGIVLAGGGARNRTLVDYIHKHALSSDVRLSDELGVPIEAREAMAFAVLGALSQDGVPITLPQVTGAKEPGRAGAWAYP